MDELSFSLQNLDYLGIFKDFSGGKMSRKMFRGALTCAVLLLTAVAGSSTVEAQPTVQSNLQGNVTGNFVVIGRLCKSVIGSIVADLT